jgi:two-component system copper resistance phosphate regulon response regulator CusR
MHILVVEDEVKMAEIMARGLKAEGYAVTTAHSVRAGMELVRTDRCDLIILDLLLPDSPGTELLRELRQQRRSVPVLIVTARSEIEVKAENFDAGADDYLTKPFAFEELVMRVKALLRRSPTAVNSTLKIADLEVDRLSRKVSRAGKRIELSPKEYSLLEYLVLNPNRVLSRTMIMDRVWDQSFEGLTNIVDVYVRQVRRKIDEGFEPKLIRTVRGIGYAIDPLGEL